MRPRSVTRRLELLHDSSLRARARSLSAKASEATKVGLVSSRRRARCAAAHRNERSSCSRKLSSLPWDSEKTELGIITAERLRGSSSSLSPGPRPPYNTFSCVYEYESLEDRGHCLGFSAGMKSQTKTAMRRKPASEEKVKESARFSPSSSSRLAAVSSEESERTGTDAERDGRAARKDDAGRAHAAEERRKDGERPVVAALDGLAREQERVVGELDPDGRQDERGPACGCCEGWDRVSERVEVRARAATARTYG